VAKVYKGPSVSRDSARNNGVFLSQRWRRRTALPPSGRPGQTSSQRPEENEGALWARGRSSLPADSSTLDATVTFPLSLPKGIRQNGQGGLNYVVSRRTPSDGRLRFGGRVGGMGINTSHQAGPMRPHSEALEKGSVSKPGNQDDSRFPRPSTSTGRQTFSADPCPNRLPPDQPPNPGPQ